MTAHRILIALVATLIALPTSLPAIAADAPAHQVLGDDQQLDDQRYKPLTDLNGYFPFDAPDSKEGWDDRAEDLRRRILVATGLWPMPEKTPLNAVIHSKVERDGYTIESVIFESVPGLYVTGSLFRPSGKPGPHPAVLSPHGHGGRLQEYNTKQVREQITKGEERFETSGRYTKLTRCAQLARMGCVTFIYDMMGYGDNRQLSYDLVHRYADRRPEMETQENWGLFSTQAELRVQSVMGLQTWNSIRALDFLLSLPDVDTTRVGVTGGSGGGTQTILLCAIDDRPDVAFPQGMVSTAMQGGCTCENCSLLRIGTGNVELAGLFAPKPQAMTAADDWTIDMMTKGYPELNKLYDIVGNKSDVECYRMTQFPHNFNYVTRAAMYAWMNKYLKLGLEEPIVEEDVGAFDIEALSVWDEEHPFPEDAQGDDFERKLLVWITERDDKLVHALAPTGGATLETYRNKIGGAIKTIIGRTLDDVGPMNREKLDKIDRGDFYLIKDILHVSQHGEQIPVVSLYPKTNEWNGQVIVWVHGGGKAALFGEDGQSPNFAAKQLLNAGSAVIGLDLFGQGEHQTKSVDASQNRKVKNPREYAGYTYTYNSPLFAQQVHDLLSVIAWIHRVEPREHEVDSLVLVGTGGAGPQVATAAALCGDALDRVAVETDGFRFTQLDSYRDAKFLPGIVKYGDVPALLALSSPVKLLVLNDEKQPPALVKKTYDLSDGSLDWRPEVDDIGTTIVEWARTK